MFLRPLNNVSFVYRVNQLLHRLAIKIYFHSSVYMLDALDPSTNLISYLEVEIFRIMSAKIEIAIRQTFKFIKWCRSWHFDWWVDYREYANLTSLYIKKLNRCLFLDRCNENHLCDTNICHNILLPWKDKSIYYCRSKKCIWHLNEYSLIWTAAHRNAIKLIWMS